MYNTISMTTTSSVPADDSTTKKIMLYFNISTIIFTLYALFGDDIRLAWAPVSSDTAFYALSVIALILFMIELAINWVSDSEKEEYRFQFYFWIDVVAILSLLPDIPWIWEPVMGLFSSGGGQFGASTKLVRVVRLVRIIRMGKLLKMATKGSKDEDVGEPSKVGQTMAEMTLKRVIGLVFLLVLALPLFDGGLNQTVNQYQQVGLQRVHHLAQLAQDYNQTGYEEAIFHKNFDQYVRLAGPLLYMEIDVCDSQNKLCCEASSSCMRRKPWTSADTSNWLQQIRFQPLSSLTETDESAAFTLKENPQGGWSYEKNYELERGEVQERFRQTEYVEVIAPGCNLNTSSITSSVYDGCVSRAYFSMKTQTVYAAQMNIAKTLVVMLILFVGWRTFTYVSHTLVIDPLMSMTTLIRTLAVNPLASTTMKDNISDKKGYETYLLMNTLTKIGALMQVGFGAAGAEIIGKNMGSAGELDPMVPGKKITAIYGFCDIRQFTDTTECLQEEVMVYVNRLGSIVHDCTHSYYGKANKNVGDAFLLSWKLCDGLLKGYADFDSEPSEQQRLAAENVLCPANEGFGLTKRQLSPIEVADSALTAFLKCLVDLENANTDGCLKRYRTHPRILQRFGPNFRIRMGFGLHVGWAIEGAIGSHFKIDATYLSPHVEMSDRLEAGSKLFGVPIQMSQWFVSLLTQGARSYLRKLDRIKVSGCSQPMIIYTFDVVNMVRDFGEPKFDEYGQQMPVDFEGDPSYKQLQDGIPKDFFDKYSQGAQAYFQGSWALAKEMLDAALVLKPSDGPIASMCQFMQKHNFEAPVEWPGYRVVENF